MSTGADLVQEMPDALHRPVWRLNYARRGRAEATPLEIAMLALERNSPRSLGLLIEVSGGQYVGDNTSYVLSTNVCARLGRLSA